MNINNRNQFGVKDSINCYLTIKGKKFIQYTDACGSSGTKEEAKEILEEIKKENRDIEFVLRKVKGIHFRIYKQEV